MKKALITVDPEIHSGTPVFAGTRVPVKTLFDHLEGGDSLEVFLDDFPSVSRELATAVLEVACVSELTAQGQTLPSEEWVRLLDLLVESLHELPTSGREAMSEAEIARRVAAHERGDGKLYSVEEVMAEAARIAP